MDKEKIKMRPTPGNVFVLGSVVCIMIMIIMLVRSGGQFLSDIVWDARNPLFADFFSHVNRVRGGRNPYVASDWDARFPPLAYMFYYFLSCIIPETIINSEVSDWYNMYMIVVLCCCLVCISYSVAVIIKRSDGFTLVFMLIFVLSHAFAMAEVKAGNSATYVLTLLILAFALKDSDSRVKRELALVLIACAAGFKVSPAIMGFLYIKEKRCKEAVRLVIYGMIAFFLPFAMFGGIEGLKIFLNITGQVSEAAIPRPETIPGVVIEVFSLLGLPEGMGSIAGRVVSFIYLAVCMFLFFKRDYSWKSVFLLSSLMVIFVNLSYPYTLQYFLIPLVMFVKDTDKEYNNLDYLYSVLFVLIWLTPPIIKIDWPTATFITNYFWVYIMVLLMLVDLFIDRNRKKNEEA